MNKKLILSKIISKLKLEIPLRNAFNISGDKINILAYHRILDDSHGFSGDKELISATKNDFEWQVKYIKQHYNAITFSELFACIEGKKSLPKNPVIITFDDGFIDNFTNAYQILRENSIPGTFFVSTDYIGKEGTFWFDFVAIAINNLPAGDYENAKHDIKFTIGNLDNNKQIIRTLLSKMKRIKNNERLELIHWLKEIYNPANISNEIMTWENVREMANNGMEIGSHSVSHPILSQLSASDLNKEIIESKLEIQEQLHIDCNVIAYPVGGKNAFNKDVEKLVEENYNFGCSYISGVNTKNNMDYYSLKRLHIERDTSKAMFKLLLACPSIFA